MLWLKLIHVGDGAPGIRVNEAMLNLWIVCLEQDQA